MEVREVLEGDDVIGGQGTGLPDPVRGLGFEDQVAAELVTDDRRTA